MSFDIWAIEKTNKQCRLFKVVPRKDIKFGNDKLNTFCLENNSAKLAESPWKFYHIFLFLPESFLQQIHKNQNLM